jgi:hypothetical protein
MRVYHLLLLLLALGGSTIFFGYPQADASDTTESINPAMVTMVPAQVQFQPISSPQPDISLGAKVQYDLQAQSPVTHIQSTMAPTAVYPQATGSIDVSRQAYAVSTNMVTIIDDAFSRLPNHEAGTTIASLSFNEGIFALADLGLISGHNTLAILNGNTSLPIEYRYTGFSIAGDRIVPSRESIHSDTLKLVEAKRRYASSSF